MPHEWFVRAPDSDEEKGPLTVTELKRIFRDGELPGTCLVRRDDMEAPRRADSIRGLVPVEEEDAEPGREPAPRMPSRRGRAPRRGSSVFRDPKPLGTAVLACLALCALASGVGVYSGIEENALSSDLEAGNWRPLDEIEAHDAFYAGVGTAQLVTLTLTAVVYLVWLYRASANQHALGVRRQRYSPGWAIGGWFIPFVNLVRPYQVVREVWENSSALATGNLRRTAPATLVLVWWGIWLVDNAASNIAARVMLNAEDLDSRQTATTLMMASDAISVTSAILAGLVVYRITSWQTLAGERAT